MLKEIVGMTKVANCIHATKIMWSTDSKPLIASQPRGSPGFSMRGPTRLPATFRFRVLRPAPAIPRTAPCLRRSQQVLQVAYGRPVRARAKAAPGSVIRHLVQKYCEESRGTA